MCKVVNCLKQDTSNTKYNNIAACNKEMLTDKRMCKVNPVAYSIFILKNGTFLLIYERIFSAKI